MRPAWLLRLGLFLYDHIGGRKLLPPTRSLDLTPRRGRQAAGARTASRSGFEYSDCLVDDARLVVLTARDAADRGAVIRTRTRAVEIRQRRRHLAASTIEDTLSGERDDDPGRARWSMPAARGSRTCWRGRRRQRARPRCGWCRARHIVVRKLYDHDRAYMFQNSDGRIVFVIPYQDDFTLIGTTDRDYDGDPAKVESHRRRRSTISAIPSANISRSRSRPQDVVWTYSGVRPLYDDGASEAKAATRDYVFELDTPGGAPLLSIYGGKITTYRRLAEEALERLAPYLPRAPRRSEGWTANVAAARRRFRRLGDRGAGGGTGARLSVPRRRLMPAGWRMPTAPAPRKCSAMRNRSADLGQSLRRHPDRERGPLPDGERMGPHRRRHRLAALQARAAAVGRPRSPRSTTGLPPTAASAERPCSKREGGHDASRSNTSRAPSMAFRPSATSR